VVGQKSGNDQVLLTLVERKSREYWMLPIKNRHADSVMEDFEALQKTYSEHFSQVFKIITTDSFVIWIFSYQCSTYYYNLRLK